MTKWKLWFPVDLFNKRETAKKYGNIKRKINPDEPSGQPDGSLGFEKNIVTVFEHVWIFHILVEYGL